MRTTFDTTTMSRETMIGYKLDHLQWKEGRNGRPLAERAEHCGQRGGRGRGRC
jgi:hypothetical protein